MQRTVDTSTETFQPITYSRRDTCPTQRQIAAHNSVYETLKTGRRVVYAAPCDVEKQAETRKTS